MMDLCKYCQLHEAERSGYCSDVCRRSMELLRAAEKVVASKAAAEGGRATTPLVVRRLARAVEELR
jgi:hypothetical protein